MKKYTYDIYKIDSRGKEIKIDDLNQDELDTFMQDNVKKLAQVAIKRSDGNKVYYASTGKKWQKGKSVKENKTYREFTAELNEGKQRPKAVDDAYKTLIDKAYKQAEKEGFLKGMDNTDKKRVKSKIATSIVSKRRGDTWIVSMDLTKSGMNFKDKITIKEQLNEGNPIQSLKKLLDKKVGTWEKDHGVEFTSWGTNTEFKTGDVLIDIEVLKHKDTPDQEISKLVKAVEKSSGLKLSPAESTDLKRIKPHEKIFLLFR